jgi:hypothetical protein
MDERVEAAFREELPDERLVADVSGDDPCALESRRVRALDRRVVEVVEVVEDRDLVAAGEELLRDVRADEAGAAGDEDAGHD